MSFFATGARINTENLTPLRHPEFISGSLTRGNQYLNIGNNIRWIDPKASLGRRSRVAEN